MIKLPHLYWLAFFLLIPLWSLPHTIAGRYICEGVLLIIILWSRSNILEALKQFKILPIFFCYLIFQLIFFSSDFKVAFQNFRAEWMHFIIFSIIGIGSGMLIGKTIHRKFLLALGLSFFIPLLIHLTLFLRKFLADGLMPWGYTGLNEIHGDLGYTALQAAIFLSCYFLLQAKSWVEKILIPLACIACVSSPLLAASRGGTGFAALAIIFTGLTYFLLAKKSILDNKSQNIWIIIFLIALLLGTYKTAIFSNPERWGGTFSRLSLGFEGNAEDVICSGPLSLKESLQNKGVTITPEIARNLDSINDGDGARIMVARTGALLTLEHPMGINQSKEAYQQAVNELCHGKPKIFISHSHNGWIDTALSIGIPGAILLLILFIRYMKIGYEAMRINNETSIYGLALFVSAWLWLLRGILDSTQRDHMLEIQAFVLALLAGIIFARSSKRMVTS
jgi:O-Antigen ligase